MPRSRKVHSELPSTEKLEKLNAECRLVLIARSLLRISFPECKFDQNQQESLSNSLRESFQLLFRIAQSGQAENVNTLLELSSILNRLDQETFAELVRDAASALVSAHVSVEPLRIFLTQAKTYLLALGEGEADRFQSAVNRDRQLLLGFEHRADWWNSLGKENVIKWPDESTINLTYTIQNNIITETLSHLSLPPSRVPIVESLLKQIEVEFVQAEPQEAKKIAESVQAKTRQIFSPTTNIQTVAETASETQNSTVEKLQQRRDAIAETARTQLKWLLSDLESHVFEPEQLNLARQLVSAVNHLAAIGKSELFFEGIPVTLSCVASKTNPRPTFNLRLTGTGDEKKTVYTGKRFPAISTTILIDTAN
jgi:hypothetical protein